MSAEERDDLILAIVLLAIAGFVDAIGFMFLGGLFISFMSGNSTQFAIGLGRASWRLAAPAGALVGLFVVGVVVGRLTASGAGRWRRPAVLALEAALLGLAAAAPLPPSALGALMALAMGAQNSVLRSIGRTKTGLTYVTGTLVSFGERLADALTGAGTLADAWTYLALWLGIFAGGVAGALVYGRIGLLALAPAALATALIAAASAAVLRRAA